MRVALLSHRGGNIGHDFMAAGWEEIVRSALGEGTHIEHFEQHRPFDIYPRHHPARLVDRFAPGRVQKVRRYLDRADVSQRMWSHARPLSFDLGISCGGPNLVAGPSPEMALMFHHLPGAFQAQGVPVLDAAVGSAYPLERIPDRITEPAEIEFWSRAFANSRAGTVRDRLAAHLFAGLGREEALIPCGAVAAGRSMLRVADRLPRDQRYFVVNFQERGANTDWGQGVDPATWAAVARETVDRLSRRHQVVLLCHNAWESRLARGIFPNTPRIQPTSVVDYARVVAGASAAFVSRLHAAIPLAGAGVPSLVAGTDTRLYAAEELGLPTTFAKTATAEAIECELEELLAHSADHEERLVAVRDTAIARYGEVIHQILGEARR